MEMIRKYGRIVWGDGKNNESDLLCVSAPRALVTGADHRRLRVAAERGVVGNAAIQQADNGQAVAPGSGAHGARIGLGGSGLGGRDSTALHHQRQKLGVPARLVAKAALMVLVIAIRPRLKGAERREVNRGVGHVVVVEEGRGT